MLLATFRLYKDTKPKSGEIFRLSTIPTKTQNTGVTWARQFALTGEAAPALADIEECYRVVG